jgi:hypothetical protein
VFNEQENEKHEAIPEQEYQQGRPDTGSILCIEDGYATNGYA